MKPLLEVCAGNMASVEAAVAGGATRIELCAALPLDGLTPSMGMIREVRERFAQLIVHVLVRPREGDFVYNEHEIAVMERDIEAAWPYADGFVVGALTREGHVDLAAMRRLVDVARGKAVTFHRAFDVCRVPYEALEQIVELGCQRVLTSGQQSTAEQGIALLRQLVRQAAGRLTVMPGGGVTPANARHILQATGCTEIHGSCSAGTGVTQAEQVRAVRAAIS